MEITALECPSAQPMTNIAAPRRSIWPFWTLLAINSLTLPALLTVFCLAQSGNHQWSEDYLAPIISVVMFGQLYLLSFWMSFGSWPRRWRGVAIFAITLIAGLVFSISLVTLEYLYGARYSDFATAVASVLPFVVGVPIFAAVVLWVTNGIFVIPAWYFGTEVGWRTPTLTNERPQRTFGIAQLFSWTAQLACPLALFNIFASLNPDEKDVVFAIVPFLVVIACCTPLLVLLRERFSLVALIACVFLSASIGISWWLLAPDDWSLFLPAWTLVSMCIAVAANLIALRYLGLCWRPREESTGHPHA